MAEVHDKAWPTEVSRLPLCLAALTLLLLLTPALVAAFRDHRITQVMRHAERVSIFVGITFSCRQSILGCLLSWTKLE